MPAKIDTILWDKECDLGKIYLVENTRKLNEVTITSGKFRRAIEDVTVSIETVKPDFLEKTISEELMTCLKKYPGLIILTVRSV